MAQYKIVKFRWDGAEHIAYGTHHEKMPVYVVTEFYHRVTPMFFPSCLKFIMPTKLSKTMDTTKEDIDEIYGPKLGESEQYIPT